MVGNVGTPRGLSRPSSIVIQEVLNLLAALGSKDPEKEELLIEMKEIQDHNTKVLDEVQLALRQLEDRTKQLDDYEKSLNVQHQASMDKLAEKGRLALAEEQAFAREKKQSEKAITRQYKVVTDKEEALAKKKTEQQQSAQAERAEIKEQKLKLKEIEVEQKKQDASLRERETALKRGLDDLSRRNVEVEAKEDDLLNKTTKIAEVMGANV